MPNLIFSTLFTANQLGVNPLSGWQYEWVPWFAIVHLLLRSSDVNLRATVYSGSETIQERSPVQGGGTPGTTPSDLNTPGIDWVAAANDRLKLTIDNVGAGTPTLDGIITANPAQMAFFNEIGAGRYNRLLQKLFNMKGGPPARQLGSDIMPVFPFFSGAEHRYLEGWNRFGQALSATANGAGNFSQIRLRNPTGSNVIAVVEKIFVTNPAGAADQPVLTHGIASGDLGTIAATANMRWDPRGGTAPTLIMSTTNVGAVTPAPANRWNAGLAVNSGFDIVATDIQEFPILPGDAIQYSSGIANQIVTASIWWRERAMEDSELK